MRGCFEKRLEHAHVQVLILSLVAFGALGIHNDISQASESLIADSVGAVDVNQIIFYAQNVVFSFFVTPFACQVSVKKLALIASVLGSLQGVLEVVAISSFPRNIYYIVGIRLIAGLSEAVLWVAIFGVVMGYATRAERSRYLATMWSFIHGGAALNSYLGVLENYWLQFAGIVFFELIGSALALYCCTFLVEPALVVKADGTYARTYKLCVISSVYSELFSVFQAGAELGVLLMIPTAFASVWTRPMELNYLIGALSPHEGNAAIAYYFTTQTLAPWLLVLILRKDSYLRPFYICSACLGLLYQVVVRVSMAHLINVEGEILTPGSATLLDVAPIVISMGIYDCLCTTLILWYAGALGEGHTRKCVRAGSLLQGVQATGGTLAWLWLRHSTFSFRLHSAITIFLMLVALPCGCLATDIVICHTRRRNRRAECLPSSSSLSTNPSFFSLYVPK